VNLTPKTNINSIRKYFHSGNPITKVVEMIV
jgi:hypothetical protein